MESNEPNSEFGYLTHCKRHIASMYLILHTVWNRMIVNKLKAT